MWAASGSEAIQKALWASLAVDPARDMILATRYGFHGKKGLAEAVTGSERDQNRDPRVRFISFPMDECRDLSLRDAPFDPAPYRAELDAIAAEHRGIACLITEPYLGGGGSYHPPAAYLQLLQDFCREHDIVFILDEVQANFGRTGQHVRLRNLRPRARHRRARQGAGQRRAGGVRGGTRRHLRRARLRRGVRHLERQPALLRRRAGHARRVREPATCSATRGGRRRSSKRGWSR